MDQLLTVKCGPSHGIAMELRLLRSGESFEERRERVRVRRRGEKKGETQRGRGEGGKETR